VESSPRKRIPWIGVDFDGTLAEHPQPPYEAERVGRPVPMMVNKVNSWLAEGLKVKILTARVGSRVEPEREAKAREAITAFCVEHFGEPLEITSEKDYDMVVLWDDLAVGVVQDTGISHVEAMARYAEIEVDPVDVRRFARAVAGIDEDDYEPNNLLQFPKHVWVPN
jgi:hypothetical protein